MLRWWVSRNLIVKRTHALFRTSISIAMPTIIIGGGGILVLLLYDELSIFVVTYIQIYQKIL